MSYTTIRFDLEDRERPAPFFRLQTPDNRWIDSTDLRGSECLVLTFLHNFEEPACRQFLSAVQAHLADYRRLNAQVAVVFQGPAAHLPKAGAEPAILFLADPQYNTRHTYADLMAAELVQENDVMLFVMDSYGESTFVWLGASPIYRRRMNCSTG
jgi:peroxiredoxin